jgi:hypothetical protein
MKPRDAFVLLTTLTLLLGTGWTHAQDGTSPEAEGDDVLEVTMRLLPPDAQAADAALREIELPARLDEETGEPVPRASEQGQLNGGAGLERANEARFEGVANGAEAAEAAQNNREEMGRGSGPPDNPGPPDSPGPPDIPSPPDNPGPPDDPGPP